MLFHSSQALVQEICSALPGASQKSLFRHLLEALREVLILLIQDLDLQVGYNDDHDYSGEEKELKAAKKMIYVVNEQAVHCYHCRRQLQRMAVLEGCIEPLVPLVHFVGNHALLVRLDVLQAERKLGEVLGRTGGSLEVVDESKRKPAVEKGRWDGMFPPDVPGELTYYTLSFLKRVLTIYIFAHDDP